MIQFALYTSYGGSLIADYSHRIRNPIVASNNHGYAECSGFIPLSLSESFWLYDRPGLPHVRFSDGSSGAIYEGRLEDVALSDGGVTVSALGYSRALSDAPYTALWSSTSVAEWRPVLNTEYNTSYPDRFTFDTNNRLYITPQKGSSQGNAPQIVGRIMVEIPHRSSRQVIGMSFDYTLSIAVNWNVGAESWLTGFTSPAGLWGVAGGAAAQAGSVNLTFTGADIIDFYLTYNAATAIVAGETGDVFLRITNLRIVTSTTNRITTTLGTNIAAGTRTVTPASMTRIFVGQSLQIDQGSATIAESVIVTAITSTTFTAVFAFAHITTSTVNAHVIYADEIADDLIATISALNSGQLSTSRALTDSPALDLMNEVYEDRLPSDILDYLAGIGDASGNLWEWGVWDYQRLSFRQQGMNARTWYIDLSMLDVQRTLEALHNSVYAVYSDASGRTLRTAATADSASVARYALTRRQALSVSSTSATQAGLQQALALNDGSDPKSRSSVTITQVFDASGARWPLAAVRAGDTMIIRNLAPTLSATIDRIRVFRLARVEYQLESETLRLEPELPRATLEALLAQVAAGVR